jgi:hypothetical protein
MDNQLRFIKEIACADLIVYDHTEASLLAELADRGYNTLTDIQGKSNSSQGKDNDANIGYAYLLELSMRVLTRDRVPALPNPPHPKKNPLVMMRLILAHACPGRRIETSAAAKGRPTGRTRCDSNRDTVGKRPRPFPRSLRGSLRRHLIHAVAPR